MGLQTVLKWAWSRSRDVSKFFEISDNIAKTVQDRDIVTVTVEDKYEIIYGLSNGKIADELK